MWFGWSIAAWESIFFFVTAAAAGLGALGLTAAFASAIIGYKISDEVTRTANLQIAEANARAEQLRSDNLRLQRAVLPRRIVMSDRDGDKEMRSARFNEVKKYAGTVALIQSVPDFEAQILASDIRTALHNSGWNASFMNEAQSHISPGLITEGVQVLSLENPMFTGGNTPDNPPMADRNWSASEAGRAAQAVAELLSLDLGPPHGPPLFGVHWSPQYRGDLTPSIFTRHGFAFPEGGVVILVGMRPLETALPPAPAPKAPDAKTPK